MRRTSVIVLTIIGAGLGLTVYNALKPAPADETRKVYKDRADCEVENKPADCEPSQGRGGYPHSSYFGPIFLPGMFGSPAGAPGAQPPGTPPGTRPTPTRPVQPIGEYRSQRGGFGGSSGGYYSGA